MNATERYGTRDLTPSNWHRKHSTQRFLGPDAARLTMKDLDGLEYCCHCNEVVGVIELAKDVGQPWRSKDIEVQRKLALRVGVPGLLVFYRVSDEQVSNGNGGFMPDIDQFRVIVFAPELLEERVLAPTEYAQWLLRLHDRCSCRTGQHGAGSSR